MAVPRPIWKEKGSFLLVLLLKHTGWYLTSFEYSRSVNKLCQKMKKIPIKFSRHFSVSFNMSTNFAKRPKIQFEFSRLFQQLIWKVNKVSGNAEKCMFLVNIPLCWVVSLNHYYLDIGGHLLVAFQKFLASLTTFCHKQKFKAVDHKVDLQ